MTNEAQFDRAFALAAAHGHWWADVPDLYRDRWSPEGALEADRIQRDVYLVQGGHPQYAGGVVPVFDGTAIVHETATGRLRWRIEADGSTLIECHRPAGKALGVVVHTDGSVLKLPGDVQSEVRHLLAVQECLAVLCVAHCLDPRARWCSQDADDNSSPAIRQADALASECPSGERGSLACVTRVEKHRWDVDGCEPVCNHCRAVWDRQHGYPPPQPEILHLGKHW